MDILPHAFRCSQLCGMWYEDNNLLILKILYKFVILTIILYLTSCEVIELFVMKGTVNEFTELLYLTCTYFTFCLKLLNFVIRKTEMIELLQLFRLPICQAHNEHEDKIIRKRKRTAGIMFLSFLTMCIPSALMIFITPLVTPGDINLPLRSYQILDLSNKMKFWFSYVLQCVTGVYSVILNVTMDTMTFGFLILSAGQFEISCYRFANSKGLVKERIQHYLLARTIAIKIQAFFIRVIVPLFCFSLVTLCTSIFEMSKKRVNSFEFFSMAVYLICMLYLVFLYCYFGNELKVQSSAVADSIYFSDWVHSTDEEKRNQRFVMLFAQRGIDVSFHGQCTLSLETFIWVTKTSYAALNLLQQVSLENQ